MVVSLANFSVTSLMFSSLALQVGTANQQKIHLANSSLRITNKSPLGIFTRVAAKGTRALPNCQHCLHSTNQAETQHKHLTR